MEYGTTCNPGSKAMSVVNALINKIRGKGAKQPGPWRVVNLPGSMALPDPTIRGYHSVW